MNFYFRKDLYGDAKVEYPVFPQLDVQEYNRLKVRNSGNDFEQWDSGWSHTKYALSNHRFGHHGLSTGRCLHKWNLLGLVRLKGIVHEDYIASHHEVDPDNLDIISNPYGGGEIHEGDRVPSSKFKITSKQ